MGAFSTIMSLKYTRSLMHNKSIFEMTGEEKYRLIDEYVYEEEKDVKLRTYPFIELEKKFYFWKWLWDIMK